MRIAILAANGAERIELEEPRGALYGAGTLSDVLSPPRSQTDCGDAGQQGYDPEGHRPAPVPADTGEHAASSGHVT